MKIAFLFPGQGTQHIGMGKEFYDNFEIVKKFYDSLSIGDFSMDFVKDLSFEGPEETLNQTTYTQPCLVAHQIVTAKLLKEFGIEADGVAGLSLGEYSALNYAGVMQDRDAVELVYKRGSIMDTAKVHGTMAAVIGIEDEVLINSCKKISNETNQVLEVANYNCPGQRVITGEKDAVTKAIEELPAKGARKVVLLKVSGPFHSSLYKDASEQLRIELDKIEQEKPTKDIYYNVTGAKSNDNVNDLMQRQIYSSVLFENSIKAMLADGYDTFIEVGPGRTLSGFVKKVDRSVKTYNVEDIVSLNKVLEAFGKQMVML